MLSEQAQEARWHRRVVLGGLFVVAISSAFAAPLLRLADEQSFGLCLAGKTGGGKTTATLAASSIFAVGNIDQLLSWNATLAGLEPALRSHNDCLLVVDDLNKMPAPTDKEKYLSTRNFAFNLGTGSAKTAESSIRCELRKRWPIPDYLPHLR